MNMNKLFDLQGKVAIVTGGYGHLGSAMVRALLAANATVIVAGRSVDRFFAAFSSLECESLHFREIDVTDSDSIKRFFTDIIAHFGSVDILVNNAAVQFPQNSIEDITEQQLERTFKTNIFSMFYITSAALPHFKPGCCIINTTSITAYRGSKDLIDYSSTKGAIVSFTRSLALSLIGNNIRVNAVAPGPIWTPLIPSSYSPQKVGQFGSTAPIGRPGQPVELASAYVFLASPEASYITGETIHVNGGDFIGG